MHNKAKTKHRIHTNIGSHKSNKQQNKHLKTDSNLRQWEAKMHLTGVNSSPFYSVIIKSQDLLAS